MGLLSHRIRVLIRSHGIPISRVIAEKWHYRTTAIYNMAAFTLLGASIYYAVKSHDSSKKFGEVMTVHEIAERFGRSGPVNLITVTGLNVKREKFGTNEDKEKTNNV